LWVRAPRTRIIGVSAGKGRSGWDMGLKQWANSPS